MSKIATPAARRSGLPVSAGSPSSTMASGRNSSLGTSGRNSSLGTRITAPSSGTPGPRLTARRSQVGLRQAASTSATALPFPQTPRRSLPSAANGHDTPSAGETSAAGAKQALKLEIGDEVYADVNAVRYIGILRHLGPVHFRPGVFAGLELTGSSEGKGRNDGCVEGQQYFACEPDNGIFFLATRVKRLGTAPSTEATARPQSAMSQRSGRSSALDDYPQPRPPSATPGKTRPTTPSLTRPAGTTPFRPSSRTSVGRPVSRASRGGARIPALPSRPRQSASDASTTTQEGVPRAQSLAEEAERAEERITEGSRAHKLLNMNARDLRARREGDPASAAFAPSRWIARSAGASTLASPPKGAATANGSPLKQGLLGQKGRASLGSHMPVPSLTPRASLGRESIHSSAAQGSMPPPSDFPVSPTKARPSLPSPSSCDSDPSTQRKLSLLEQMDLLTPRRPVQSSPRMPEAEDPFSTAEEYGQALAPNEDGATDYFMDGRSSQTDSSGVVPIALLEQSNLENMQVKAQLSEAQAALHETQTATIQRIATETEKARVAALEEARKELEEERRVEQEDYARRRKLELDAQEKLWQDKLAALQREASEARDDGEKLRLSHERKIEEMEARTSESEALALQLKASVSSSNTSTAQAEAVQLELTQLKDRLQRSEEATEKTQAEHAREVDDLKSAGQEALDMYVSAENASQQRIHELEDSLRLLQARAQEAIAEAERQRDEAVMQHTETNRRLQASAASTISAIDHQSLQQQLEQAQSRVTHLEDQVAEVNAVLVQERESYIRRRDRQVDAEKKYKDDIAQLKASVKTLEKSGAEARRRANELNDALEESRATLESERGELEMLRAETLITVNGPNNEAVLTAEKTRYEAELERLHGLLEGARSGKREASRQADELRAHNIELSATLKDAKEQAFAEVMPGRELSLQTLSKMRQDSDILRSSGRSSAEQVEALFHSFEREFALKDREILSLRRHLQDVSKSSSHENGGTPSRGTSMDGERSPAASSGPFNSSNDSGFNNLLGSPGWSAGRRVSSTSTVSRRSNAANNTASTMLATSEGAAKELAGLRSLVNTLNQELTEQKIASTQRERELKNEVETLRVESRRTQLRLDEQQKSVAGDSSQSTVSDIDARVELETQARNAQGKVADLEARLTQLEKAKREEANKLNRDIAELEALCEATVWPREEQEAKREDLERKVAKLQQQLADRAGAYSSASDHDRPDSAMTVSSPTARVFPDSKPTISAALRHSRTASILSELTCDDCGETGHKMEQCPYVNDDMLF